MTLLTSLEDAIELGETLCMAIYYEALPTGARNGHGEMWVKVTDKIVRQPASGQIDLYLVLALVVADG